MRVFPRISSNCCNIRWTLLQRITELQLDSFLKSNWPEYWKCGEHAASLCKQTTWILNKNWQKSEFQSFCAPNNSFFILTNILSTFTNYPFACGEMLMTGLVNTIVPEAIKSLSTLRINETNRVGSI